MLGVATSELRVSDVNYDKMESFLLGWESIQPKVLDLAKWQAKDYVEKPQWGKIPMTTSLYVAHAPEIARVPTRRQHAFRFRGIVPRKDTALRILRYLQ